MSQDHLEALRFQESQQATGAQFEDGHDSPHTYAALEAWLETAGPLRQTSEQNKTIRLPLPSATPNFTLAPLRHTGTDTPWSDVWPIGRRRFFTDAAAAVAGLKVLLDRTFVRPNWGNDWPKSGDGFDAVWVAYTDGLHLSVVGANLNHVTFCLPYEDLLPAPWTVHLARSERVPLLGEMLAALDQSTATAGPALDAGWDRWLTPCDPEELLELLAAGLPPSGERLVLARLGRQQAVRPRPGR